MTTRDPVPPFGNSYDDVDEIHDGIIESAVDLKQRLGQLASRPGTMVNREIPPFPNAVDYSIHNRKSPDMIRKEVGMLFTGSFFTGYDFDIYDVNFITLRCLVEEAAVKNSPEFAETGVDQILEGFNINKADYSRVIREIISFAREEQE